MSTKFIHPLTDWALAQFDEKQLVHDRFTLAVAMGSPSLPPSGSTAYITVAHDILEVLRQNGHLVQDDMGWYRRATPP